MGWAAAIFAVFTFAFGIFKAVVWFKSRKYKDQEAAKELIDKSKETGDSQDVISAFNKLNRHR